MIKVKQIVLTALILFLFISCKFINNSFKFKDKTKDFVETLTNEDYDKCIDLMAIEYETDKNINTDELKIGLANFRQIIIDNWGQILSIHL